MSQSNKLIERMLKIPKDFTFDEMTVLLKQFGYSQAKGGKAGGSRVSFSNSENDYIRVHKPHPRNVLKTYQVKNLINDLKERKLI